MVKKGVLRLLVFTGLLGFYNLAMAVSYNYKCSSEYCKANKKYFVSVDGGALGVYISCANSMYAYLDAVDYENSLGAQCSLANKTLTSLIISCFVASIGSANWLELNTVTCKTQPPRH